MESLSTWNGTISLDDFQIAAKRLSERWKEVEPSASSWRWIECRRFPYSDSHKADGFLSLEEVYLLKFNKEIQVEDCHSGEEESLDTHEIQVEDCYSGEEESVDAATLVKSYDQEIHNYDFHILYSSSYQVPVLYFRGYKWDGQPLALDDFQEDLPSCSSRLLVQSKWTFITQEEHPYLKRPWYTLHPCGTSDWMKLLFHGSSFTTRDSIVQQYLLSWLSVVGQAVGLKVPLRL